MSPDVVAPALGTAVSAVFTLSLARRWLRSRRAALGVWALALAAFTVGIAALGWGGHAGFDPALLRTYYLAGGLLAAPLLGLGEVELLSSSRRARWWARGVTLALVVPGVVLIITDPLNGPVSGTAVPDGSVLFGGWTRLTVALSNIVGTGAVIGGVSVTAERSARGGPPARARLRGAVGILVGALLAATAGTFAGLGVPGLQPVVLALGVVVMYAGFRQTTRRVGSHRDDPVARRRERRRLARDARITAALPEPPALAPLPDAVTSRGWASASAAAPGGASAAVAPTP